SAKEGDALPLAPGLAGVVFRLFGEPFGPTRLEDAFKYALDQLLLVLGEKPADDGGRGDPPGVGDLEAKGEGLAVLARDRGAAEDGCGPVVPREANLLLLPVGQGVIKGRDRCFGRIDPGGRCGRTGFRPSGESSTRKGKCRAGGIFQESP